YDGTALTKKEYTSSGLVGGDRSTTAAKDTISKVIFTGSQTLVGESANTPSDALIVNNEGRDVTDSYSIKYVSGTLKVTKRTVTIAANSDSKQYDGTPLTDSGYTVQAKTADTGLADGDKVSAISVVGSQTRINTAEDVNNNNIVEGSVKITNSNNEYVTDSYKIELVPGTLTVGMGTAIQITAGSKEKTYDGTALTCSNYEITSGALSTGHKIETITFTSDSTITYAGSTTNVIDTVKIVDSSGNDVTSNYTISTMPGLLTVDPKEITVTAGSTSKTYDGTALTYTKFKVADTLGNADAKELSGYASHNETNTGVESAALQDGEKINVTLTGTRTVAGNSPNKAGSIVVRNAKGDNITSSYKINCVDGTLTINPRDIVITAKNLTKEYDGTALTSTPVVDGVAAAHDYSISNIADGDSINALTFDGSQTIAGTGDTTPKNVQIVNGSKEDVTASYNIAYVGGDLEVTKKSLKITAGSDTRIYDGTPLIKHTFTSEGLVGGDTDSSTETVKDKISKVTYSGSQTIVGKCDNMPSAAKILNQNGKEVTESYDITYVKGTLEVTQRTVIITAKSANKEYDGTPLTCNDYTVQAKTADTGLADGDKVSAIEVVGSQTELNTATDVDNNNITEGSVKISNSNNEDVTGSYNIVLKPGTLTIGSGTPITITAGSDSKTYDGTALTSNGYEITSGSLSTGHKIKSVTFSDDSTITYAGSKDNVITSVTIVDTLDSNKDVTDNYTISTINGTLTVNPKEIKVTAGSAGKTYDGTALTNTTFKVADTIGNADETDLTGYSSYDVNHEGVESAALVANDKINVTITGSRTLAGSSANKAGNAVVRNAAGDDITGSYKISYVDGSLVVNKKALVISANYKTKTYDGTALVSDVTNSNDYTIGEVSGDTTVKTLAAGDTIKSIEYDGSQTIAGKSDTLPKNVQIVNSSNVDVTASYSITYNSNTLEVTKKALKITADDAEKIYDGTPLIKHSCTSEGLVGGDTAAGTTTIKDTISKVVYSGLQTIVGECKNTPSSATILNNTGKDVTESYNISYVAGTLKVTQREVTIHAKSANKEYDGTPLVCNDYTVDAKTDTTGLVDGDKVVAIEVVGSQTEINTASDVNNNNITEGSVKINNSNNENVTASYKIILKPGTLTVGSGTPITITAGSASKTYDGTALTCSDYELTSGALSTGHKIEKVTFDYSTTDNVQNSKITYEGSTDNVIDTVKIVDTLNNNEDVTSNYTISTLPGKLTINPKEIRLTARSVSKTYDGIALTIATFKGDDGLGNADDNYLTAYETYSAANEGVHSAALIGDDKINVVIEGSQTIAGSSPNKITRAVVTTEINGVVEDISSSYKISVVDGILKVNKKNVTITANNKTKEYDGTALVSSPVVNGVGSGDYTLGKEDGESIVDTLAANDSIYALSFDGSQTVYGKNETTPKDAVIVDRDGADVTECYNITYDSGILEVTQKPLTITATDKGKVYDGTALTSEEYTTTDLAAGDEIYNITFTGSQSDIGQSTNTPSKAIIVNGTGKNVTASYLFTYKAGTLNVSTRDITIVANSASKQYDGTPLVCKEYTVLNQTSTTGLADGDRITDITIVGSETEINTGEEDNNIIKPGSVKITNSYNENVTKNYNIILEPGTLTVGKGDPLTLTAGDATKTYDGTPLTCSDYEISSGALSVGHEIRTVTFSDESTITYAGNKENKITGVVIVDTLDNDKVVTDNYTLSFIPGSLTVNPKAITITAGSDTKIYDGTAITNTTFKTADGLGNEDADFLDGYSVYREANEGVHAAALAADDKLNVVLEGSQTLAGTSANKVRRAVVTAVVNGETKDITDSYDISF
ncbi:MAG: hypothetical protein K6G11_09430, partial [Lachnospiraceae bacterium]|nr:hypothetical protein [Lachnospiraceae bacterium]